MRTAPASSAPNSSSWTATPPPTSQEQVAEYRAIAAAMSGRRVTLRTLDVGGDKPLTYLPMPAEDNPFLGLRGLRLSLERPALLRDQLLADLRGGADGADERDVPDGHHRRRTPRRPRACSPKRPGRTVCRTDCGSA